MKFIEENFTYILELYYTRGIPNLLKQIKDINGIEKIILNNIRNVLRKTKSEDIFEVLDILKGYKKLLRFLEELPCYDVNATGEDEKIYSILMEKIIDTEHTLRKDKLIDFCKEVFREIFKKEKLSIVDLKACGNGRWSKCYNIGSVVIKLGRMRATNIIPDHPRIIKSIYRKPMAPIETIRERKDKYDLDELWGRKVIRHIEYIEIMPLVETNESIAKKKFLGEKVKYKEITREDLYRVYKELRDAGIVWADPKIENLGRLIKRNEVNYHGITNPDENATGIQKRDGQVNEVLGPGEIVIIDTDFIFYENDPKLKSIGYREDIRNGFDRRYNEELKEIDKSR